MNNQVNFILNSDSYKASHFMQYPSGAEYVYSYIESRGGEYDETLFFGLQMFMKEYLEGVVVTQNMVEEADLFLTAHGEPFNREGWEYIVNECGGMLPIEIGAVPEGVLVPTGNMLVYVVNTDPNVPWLTSYVETAILRAIWYPTTVATQSNSIKKVITKFLQETGTPEAVGFKLHDFGSRGVSSYESAGIGAAAHLVNFMGTDTITGAMFAQKYYGVEGGMAGFSIPAAEHSTTTLRGPENETQTYREILEAFGGPNKLVAVVSDSYDIYNAIENIWGKELKEEVLNLGAMGGTLVIRPDSGDPTSVVLKCVKLLDEAFGSEENDKGFKVLNPAVRVIQGDGINEQSIYQILTALKINGYSADNVGFGMGGALLQIVNRDTMKFAMKASAAMIDGKWVDVFKDPITDSGKRSKKGILTTICVDGEYKTIRRDTVTESESIVDRVVFRNGEILVTQTFDEVRENSNQ